MRSQNDSFPSKAVVTFSCQAAGTGTATLRFTLRPTVGAVNQTAEDCEQAVIPVADTLRLRRNSECGNELGMASRTPRTFSFHRPDGQISSGNASCTAPAAQQRASRTGAKEY